MNEKEKLIFYRIEKSISSRDDAKFLIDNDKLNIAVNRLYYSIYYVLSALSLIYDYETSKHSQLLGWFNKNFIHTKIFEINTGKTANKVFDQRTKADYDDFVEFTKERLIKCMKKLQNLLI